MAFYLDHNATTPMKPPVLALMSAVLGECGNASSLHGPGRAARRHVEDAREKVATLTGHRAANVVFTSGATEANNMILKGPYAKIAVSAIEHPSVLEANSQVRILPAQPSGVIDLAALERHLESENPELVAVMAVNNETGVVQPVSEIGRLCKQYGALFHCDAVQAAGRIDIDFAQWNCDFLTLSAHKMGGPMGAGALLFKSGVKLPKLLHGGGQEKRQRAGTENVAAIAGFGLAAELALKDKSDFQKLSALRDALEKELDAVVHGKDAQRVANTSCFSVKGRKADTMLMALDLKGIYVSSGSACSSGSVKPSHVLQAMGVSDDLCTGALRVSLGWNTTENDVNEFVKAMKTI